LYYEFEKKGRMMWYTLLLGIGVIDPAK
jgi:hypothetical protein